MQGHRGEPADLDFPMKPGDPRDPARPLLRDQPLSSSGTHASRARGRWQMTAGRKRCLRCEAEEARLLLRPERPPGGGWRSVALVILLLVSIALAALAGYGD